MRLAFHIAPVAEQKALAGRAGGQNGGTWRLEDGAGLVRDFRVAPNPEAALCDIEVDGFNACAVEGARLLPGRPDGSGAGRAVLVFDRMNSGDLVLLEAGWSDRGTHETYAMEGYRGDGTPLRPLAPCPAP